MLTGMSIQLDIPVIQQAVGSLDCGWACVKMIAHFFGRDITDEDLQRDLPIRPDFGLYIYEIGTYFQKRNFHAQITCLNTHYLNLSHVGASPQEIKQHIQACRANEKYRQLWDKWRLQEGIDTILDYIDADGDLIPQIPTAQTIKEAIDAGYPVLIALTSLFLYSRSVCHNEHFAVITGYDDTHFYMNDPGQGAKGEMHRWPVEQIIYAIHANTARSVEGGSILIVRPR
jgi:hypothetical protein